MERKEITSKKETKIRTKQESKTESSERGLLRKTKSESTIESRIVKTELLIERFSIQSHNKESEASSNHLEMNINSPQEPASDRISGGDFDRLENLQLNRAIEDEAGQGDILHREESTSNDNLVELEGFSDHFIRGFGNNKRNMKSENEVSCLNSNDNELSSDLRRSNSLTSLKILARKSPNLRNEKRRKEPDLENKNCNAANKDETQSTDISIRVTTSINYVNNPVMESNFVNGETVSISKASHDGGGKVTDTFKGQEIGITEKNSNASKEGTKEDSGFLSSEDNDEKEELDTETLEKSVRYLVSYFENLKNAASKQNKVRTHTSKKVKISETHSDKTEEKAMAVKQKDDDLIDSSLSISLNNCSNFRENITKESLEITPELDKELMEEKSVTNTEVPCLTTNNDPQKPVMTTSRGRRLCSPTIRNNLNGNIKQAKRNQERKVTFSHDAIALKTNSNASDSKLNRLNSNKHRKPLLKHPCFPHVVSPLTAFSNRNNDIYSTALLFNRRVANNLEEIKNRESETANNAKEVLSSEQSKETSHQKSDVPEGSEASSSKKKGFITKKRLFIVLSVAAVFVHVVCIFYIR